MIAARRLRSRLRAGWGRARPALAKGWKSARSAARFAWRVVGPPLRALWRGLKRLGRPLLSRLLRLLAIAERLLRRAGRWTLRRLRAGAALAMRVAAAIDKRLRRAGAALVRGATRASAVITPSRAVAGVVVGAAVCLVVSQFLDYRSIEIGQPEYAGLPSIAEPPKIEARSAGEAHGYAMIPLAALAAIGALASAGGRRRSLAGGVALLGLAGIAISLAIDMPAGLDEGTATIRFAGASATLDNAFYAQLAACAVLVLGGLLLYGPKVAWKRTRVSRSIKRPRKPSRSGDAGRTTRGAHKFSA